MHYCTFILIGSKGDPELLVASALAPFDEDLAVAEYRRYLDKYEVTRMAKHYAVKAGVRPRRGREGLADRNAWRCFRYQA